MEKKFKGTQRESVVTESSDGYTLCANGKYEFIVSFGKTQESKENIDLCLDALNTIQKCDLMPSELLSERDEWKLNFDSLTSISIEYLNDNGKLKSERDELIEFIQDFYKSISDEEIIIQENLDNDGFENCGGRLISKAQELLTKMQKL